MKHSLSSGFCSSAHGFTIKQPSSSGITVACQRSQTRQRSASPRVVFGACVRDAARSVRAGLDLITTLGDSAGEYGAILYEDGSGDHTRTALMGVLEEQPLSSRVRLILADSPGAAYSRTERLALCRNVVLRESLAAAAAAPDALLMLFDFDCDHKPLLTTSIFSHAVSILTGPKPAHDVLFGNSRPRYYDLWALRSSRLGINHDCLSNQRGQGGHCFEHAISLDENAPPLPVDSAFNGVALFRLAALGHAHRRPCAHNTSLSCMHVRRQCAYNGSATCEHVAFHRCLRRRGVRLAILPSLVQGCGSEHMHDDIFKTSTTHIAVDGMLARTVRGPQNATYMAALFSKTRVAPPPSRSNGASDPLDEAEVFSGGVWPQPTRGGGGARHRKPLLVIVYGSNRGGPPTWHALHTNLLRPTPRAELMLVLPAPWVDAMRKVNQSTTSRSWVPSMLARNVEAVNSGAWVPHVLRAARRLLYDRAQHVVAIREREDWGDALDAMEAHGRHKRSSAGLPPLPPWRERLWDTPCYDGGPLGGVKAEELTCADRGTHLAVTVNSSMHRNMFLSSAALGGVYRWYAKRALVSRGLLDTYEWFIFTRTDTYILCAQPLPSVRPPLINGSRRVAYAPAGEGENEGDNDFFGLYDRFLLASPSAIVHGLNTIEHFVVNNTPLVQAPKTFANAESMLLEALQRGNVSILRMPRRTFIASYDGDVRNGDRQRWAKCRDDLPTSPLLKSLKLCTRYCQEFAGALGVCAREHPNAHRGEGWSWLTVEGKDADTKFSCPSTSRWDGMSLGGFGSERWASDGVDLSFGRARYTAEPPPRTRRGFLMLQAQDLFMALSWVAIIYCAFLVACSGLNTCLGGEGVVHAYDRFCDRRYGREGRWC